MNCPECGCLMKRHGGVWECQTCDHTQDVDTMDDLGDDNE